MLGLIRFIRTCIRAILGRVIPALRRPEIILIYRMPSSKKLRTHLLGLTLGFTIVSLNILLSHPEARLLSSLVLLLWFALVSYEGGLLFLLAFVTFIILQWLSPASRFTVHSQWYFFSYLFGCIFVILYKDLLYLFMKYCEPEKIKISFAYDSNQMINIIKSPYEIQETAMLKTLKPIMFYLNEIKKNASDRVAMHENAEVIKQLISDAYAKMSRADHEYVDILLGVTPADNFRNRLEALRDDLDSGVPEALDLVEKHLEPLVERYLQLKERKLYNYKIETPPVQPFTIAFVANPKIRKRGKDENDEADGYSIDPLIYIRELFLRSVDRALFSLERNEIIGRPEIWSRIRVVTIFDSKMIEESGKEFGLVQEFQEAVTTQSGEEIDHNLIEPRRLMNLNFMRTFNASWHKDHEDPELRLSDAEHPKLDIKDVDMIFALTASFTHDRAMAHFADWLQLENKDANAIENDLSRDGVPFEFDINPCRKPNNEAVPPDIVFPDLTTPGPTFRRVHEFYAQEPGRVAVNVLSADSKTYVHEFAHVLSSIFHGTICDEYVDFFNFGPPKLDKNGKPIERTQEPHFFVNRISRKEEPMRSATPVPIPKVFAEYNCTRYHSDLHHPTAEEGWVSFYPEKADHVTPCTMDADRARFRFDELLSSFIYDRLMAKVGRPSR